MDKWKWLMSVGLVRANDGGGDGGGAAGGDGGGGDGGGTGGGAGGAQQQQQAPNPSQVAAQHAQQQAAQSAEWDGKVESLPPGAQDLIRNLRSENASKRTQARDAEQQQRDAILSLARAAGIEVPGDEPDANALTQQLATSQQQARQAQVELAVYREAGAHQGDPAALLDSRTFLANVSNLDPTAEDFTTKVGDAIKAAVAGNPKLKTVPATGASAAEHAGGSGEHTRTTPASLEAAVTAALAGK